MYVFLIYNSVVKLVFCSKNKNAYMHFQKNNIYAYVRKMLQIGNVMYLSKF